MYWYVSHCHKHCHVVYKQLNWFWIIPVLSLSRAVLWLEAEKLVLWWEPLLEDGGHTTGPDTDSDKPTLLQISHLNKSIPTANLYNLNSWITISISTVHFTVFCRCSESWCVTQKNVINTKPFYPYAVTKYICPFIST